jgi:polyketide biosynthesis enoyl-CoA hydratase PksI
MLSSPVVRLHEIDKYIVQITLEDRENKNSFSDGIVGGVTDAFKKINASDRYKAVIITGYDNYFCTGGTKAGLLSLHQGKSRFSDGCFYSLPLECSVPVISAMQGHAVGGGFIFGLYSDMIVLSRESVYSTNFMKFGFTPGFGSTYILKEKLGLPLAQEMLLSARNYRGDELAQRGVPFPVLPKAKVLDYCVELAQDIAEKPRHPLIMLKSHMVSRYRAELPEYIQKEEDMHDHTFHSDEVNERIENYFSQWV